MGLADRIRGMVDGKGTPQGVRGPLDAGDPQDAALLSEMGGATLVMRAPNRTDHEDGRAYLVARTDPSDEWGFDLELWRTCVPSDGGPAQAYAATSGLQRIIRADLAELPPGGVASIALSEGPDARGMLGHVLAQDRGGAGMCIGAVVTRSGSFAATLESSLFRVVDVRDDAAAASRGHPHAEAPSVPAFSL